MEEFKKELEKQIKQLESDEHWLNQAEKIINWKQDSDYLITEATKEFWAQFEAKKQEYDLTEEHEIVELCNKDIADLMKYDVEFLLNTLSRHNLNDDLMASLMIMLMEHVCYTREIINEIRDNAIQLQKETTVKGRSKIADLDRIESIIQEEEERRIREIKNQMQQLRDKLKPIRQRYNKQVDTTEQWIRETQAEPTLIEPNRYKEDNPRIILRIYDVTHKTLNNNARILIAEPPSEEERSKLDRIVDALVELYNEHTTRTRFTDKLAKAVHKLSREIHENHRQISQKGLVWKDVYKPTTSIRDKHIFIIREMAAVTSTMIDIYMNKFPVQLGYNLNDYEKAIITDIAYATVVTCLEEFGDNYNDALLGYIKCENADELENIILSAQHRVITVVTNTIGILVVRKDQLYDVMQGGWAGP